MRIFRILPIIILLFIGKLQAQKMQMVVNGKDTFYIMEPLEGDKLYAKGDIKGAIKAYQKLMKKDPQNNSMYHNIACCFTKDGQYDSAFKYLNLDLQLDTFPNVYSDPDLLPLRYDGHWAAYSKKLMEGIKIKYSSKLKNFELAKMLWEMQAKDQAYYYEIDLADKKMGMNSPVSNALWTAKENFNRQNVETLDSIINASGWPKISEVGQLGSVTAFLIIQHSTLQLQLKYLPVIKSLCEAEEASWQSYAYMYDRVQTGLERPQLYGSQLKFNPETKKYELFPIEDEKNVNKRRAELGMQPLEDYLEHNGIKYVPVK
ncbi:MAG: DUF6624 domain-containing protein [Bacteroidia bacterium]